MGLLRLAKPAVERFPRIAKAYREVRDLLDERPAVVTPWGFSLAGNLSMANGSFEPQETEVIRHLLRESDVLVNVGANIGYYCCHALSLGKPAIAFEPLPRNVRHLCRNVKLNGWSCEIYPVALSDHVGVEEIFGGDTGASLLKGWAGGSSQYTNLTPCSTLDLMMGSRLRGKRVLVVLDVEGAERWVLEGAPGLLSNAPKPVWMIEISVAENQPAGTLINPQLVPTFEIMFAAGYHAFTGTADMRPVTLSEVKSAADGNPLALPIHNFLFRSA